MMWKKKLIYALCCLLPLSAHASTIPSYSIMSLNSTSILLTDLGEISINGMYRPIVDQWMPGDQLYLGQANVSLFPPTFVDVGGIPVIAPMFVVQNATQGTSAIGYLSSNPSFNPMLLLTVNPVNGVIITTGPQIWRIRPSDRRFFVEWQVNDVVMIGKNLGTDRGTYDTIIFNATRFETVNAYEMPP